MRILDTDTCVEILRGNSAVVDRRLEVDGAVVTTWITACELLYGAARSRDPEANRHVAVEFLTSVPSLEFNAEVAHRFGELKAGLERAGARLDDFDVVIAATALAYDGVLVTGNARHYARIGSLRTENWIQRAE